MFDGQQRDGRDPRKARQGERATDPAAIEEFYRNNYFAAQYVFVQFFADHLADLSRSFRGDLEAMLLLATLGQVHLQHAKRMVDAGAPDDLPHDANLGWTTASRLADVTGIPRQTVRRKLLALQERGWIEQNEQQGWALRRTPEGTPARVDLSELDLRAMKRVAKLIADFNTLLVRTMPPGLLILAT